MRSRTRSAASTAGAARAPAPPLSRRQQDVLRCLVRGMADREISDYLKLSPHTVDYHLRQLRKRFGARNRVQLILATQGLQSLAVQPRPPAGER